MLFTKNTVLILSFVLISIAVSHSAIPVKPNQQAIYSQTASTSHLGKNGMVATQEALATAAWDLN